MRAATISACLRRGGLNPLGSGTPYDREGVRVKQSREQVRAASYEFERRPVTFDVGDIDVLVVTGRKLA